MTRSWQRALAHAVVDVEDLLNRLALRAEDLPALRTAQPFALRVPLSFIERMERGNPHDPLLQQVLPIAQEDKPQPGFHSDPVAEQQMMPVPGLIHKYAHRVLLITNPSCPIHCRYCFRRHFPYKDNSITPEVWQTMYDYIASHPEITEIIFSGGEPLLLPNQHWAMYFSTLASLSHIQLIRIHSRMPIVLPERLEPGLYEAWRTAACPVTLVLHVNHPREINQEVIDALKPLREQGVVLLNQSVLLKGINDDAKVLAALSYRLYQAGILPYYLHQLDPVDGAQHFEVERVDAQRLMRAIIKELPGYLVPRLVEDTPHQAHKTWINF